MLFRLISMEMIENMLEKGRIVKFILMRLYRNAEGMMAKNHTKVIQRKCIAVKLNL